MLLFSYSKAHSYGALLNTIISMRILNIARTAPRGQKGFLMSENKLTKAKIKSLNSSEFSYKSAILSSLLLDLFSLNDINEYPIENLSLDRKNVHERLDLSVDGLNISLSIDISNPVYKLSVTSKNGEDKVTVAVPTDADLFKVVYWLVTKSVGSDAVSYVGSQYQTTTNKTDVTNDFNRRVIELDEFEKLIDSHIVNFDTALRQSGIPDAKVMRRRSIESGTKFEISYDVKDEFITNHTLDVITDAVSDIFGLANKPTVTMHKDILVIIVDFGLRINFGKDFIANQEEWRVLRSHQGKIIPIVPNRKTPMFARGIDFSDSQLNNYQADGAGLALSYRKKFFTVDVDSMADLVTFLNENQKLRDIMPLFDETLSILTPAKHMNFIFLQNEDAPLSGIFNVGNHISVHSSMQGYTIIPPTAINGKPYTWLSPANTDDIQIKTATPELVSLLRQMYESND